MGAGSGGKSGISHLRDLKKKLNRRKEGNIPNVNNKN
jgi:hypothetical protein